MGLFHQKLFVTTPTLGSRPRQGLTKVRAECEGQESHFMLLGMWESVREWTPHTPKWTPTLGIGVLMDFGIFKEQLQGSKPIGLKSSLYHWKPFGMKMFKMGSHDPFGHLKHKLWPKERPKVKFSIWLSTTKS